MAKSQTILVAGHVSVRPSPETQTRLLLLLLGSQQQPTDQLAIDQLVSCAMRLLHFRFCCCCPCWVKSFALLRENEEAFVVAAREFQKQDSKRSACCCCCCSLEDVASRSTSCIICFSPTRPVVVVVVTVIVVVFQRGGSQRVSKKNLSIDLHLRNDIFVVGEKVQRKICKNMLTKATKS